MIKLFRDIIVPDTGGQADPIPQEVRDKIEAYVKDNFHFAVLNPVVKNMEFGYSLALPRIKELEQALEKIITMKREPGETNDTYAFNRCWHIATKALTGKKEGEV